MPVSRFLGTGVKHKGGRGVFVSATQTRVRLDSRGYLPVPKGNELYDGCSDAFLDNEVHPGCDSPDLSKIGREAGDLLPLYSERDTSS